MEVDFVCEAIVVVIVVVNDVGDCVDLCWISVIPLFFSKSQTIRSGLKTVVAGQDITKA